jgi:hypothetical protein
MTIISREENSHVNNIELADRLRLLWSKHREEWRVEEEPHSYKDGTDHFNHVRYTAKHMGDNLTVEVAQYVTPELGELLCLLHNNLDRIVPALRALANGERT